MLLTLIILPGTLARKSDIGVLGGDSNLVCRHRESREVLMISGVLNCDMLVWTTLENRRYSCPA